MIRRRGGIDRASGEVADVTEKHTTLAKLSAPRLHAAVRRERLFTRLDTLRALPASWVCGPPGAGKTTLAASWIEARGIDAYWYRMDPGDRDPAAFFDYLGQRARHSFGRRARTLPYFTADYARDPLGFARRYFRRWFELLPEGAILVIDNHHEAGGDPVDPLLREAVEEVPSHAHLMIVTRAELPSPLLRALAGGRLGRLAWDELLLTEPETADLVALHADASTTRTRDLHALSGGWAAGVVLMSAAPDLRLPTPAGNAESAASAFAYLAEEVLDRAPPDDRDLLVRTACFPQFTAAMAQALTGHPDAGAVLDRLFRDHYFTERRVAAEPEYRYHDLFRAFLRERARAELGEAGWRILLARAAALLDERSEVEAAADLLMQGGHWEPLRDIVIRHADALLARGRTRTVLAWLDAMPETIVHDSPWLLYWKGAARVAQGNGAGQSLLEAAFEGFARMPDWRGRTLACSAIMDTYFQSWNAVAALDRWIDEMTALLARPELADGPLRDRAVASIAMALLYRIPAHPALPGYVDELESGLARHERVNERVNERVATAAFLFDYFSLNGRFPRGDVITSLTAADAAHEDCLPVNAFLWWQRGGLFLYRAGRLDEARDRIERSMVIAREHGLVDAEFMAMLTLGMVCASAGDTTRAGELLREMRGALNPLRHVHAVGYHYLDLWLAVLAEDAVGTQRVWDVFAQMPLAGVPVNTAYNQPVVWKLVHDDAAAAALERVERWRVPLAGMRSPLMDFNLLTMEAYARLALDDEDATRTTLATLFALGARERFRTNLTWLPRMMSELCAAALARDIEPEYVRWLIRERALEPPTPDAPGWPRPLEIRTLGGFGIFRHGEAVSFGHKTPRKPLALLKAIVAAGDRGLPSETACHWLWPDHDGDAAAESLASAVHRLRRLLDAKDAIVVSDGRLSLAPAQAWVDAFAFERQAADPGGAAALALYRGAFLPHDDTEHWTVPVRERLRSRFVRLVEDAAGTFERRGELDRAIAEYRRGIDADPLAESFYQGLMRCYAELDRRAEGAAVFRQLRQTLSVVLGVAPSAQSLRLGRMLLGTDADGP